MQKSRWKTAPRTAAIGLAFVLAGSVFAVTSPKASAAIGDLTHVRCYGPTAAEGGQQPYGCPDGSAPATQVQGSLVSPDDRFLYTWNGARVFSGGKIILGEIHLYRRDVTGAITYVTCYGNNRGCTSFDANNQSIFDVKISPDGKFLYAMDYLGQAIYVFGRNAETGGLTFASCVRDAIPSDTRPSPCTEVAALRFPTRLALTSGVGVNESLFASTAQGGITWFAPDPTTGSLIFQGCIHDKKSAPVVPCRTAPGLATANAVAVSRDGGSVFVTSRANLVVLRRLPSRVLEFVSCFGNARTDVSDNRLIGDSECTPVPGLGFATDIDVHPSDFGVYVTASNSDAISHYTRDPATGRLFFIGCLRDVRKPEAGCNTIPVPRPIYVARPSSVAFSDDGSSLYVTASESKSIVPFSVDPRNGSSPTQRGCWLDAEHPGLGCAKVQGLGGAQDATVSPDGISVYIAGREDDSIVHFARERDNICKRIPTACQGVGAGPGADTTAPDTSIESAPKPKTRSSVATFSFSSETDATFECSLDGGDFEPCSSPRVYANLAKGMHSFQVAAIDPAGNRDSTPAKSEWKIRAKRKP
jgi:sugar lactone lactonase YvrE